MYSSEALHELIKNMLSSKKNTKYSPALREFACSLLFYSTSAYKYLRERFLFVLPCPQTIRRWFSKIDLSPGISLRVINSVKSMIEKERANGKELQFGLQLDEMSIKKQVELRNNRWYGVVDLGISDNNKKLEEASYALVVMLVCLNGHFKTPLAYYFVNGLSGSARVNMLRQLLLFLHENGISDVRTVTFDGASTNILMVAKLGADVRNIDNECIFKHPATSEPIVVIPDACHMLKLVRNALSEYILLDSNNNKIEWRFIADLVDVQELEGLHLGTKIRRRHVEFQKEKMKVKLAAQTLSTRVADALKYLENTNPHRFSGAQATSCFCQVINDTFDVMNSRRKFGTQESQNCISEDNIIIMGKKVFQLINYITSLRVLENGREVPILKSRRKVGFWGFVIGLKGVIFLAYYLFTNNIQSYLLTYKLSQDHLETFFSAIRKMGGFNNNPSCFQFQCAYKKLVSHVNSIDVEGNCTTQDDTKILKINPKNVDPNNDFISVLIDHDYIGSNGWCFNEYQNDVVSYIAGSIVKSIKNKIQCPMCRDSLESDDKKCPLITIKNKPVPSISDKKTGLVFPSQDVIYVCKIAEKVIRNEQNLFKNNITQILMLHAKRLLLPLKLFEHLTEFVEKDFLSSHKSKLVDQILNKYFKLRLHHETQTLQDRVQRIRHYHSKLILFKNQ